MFRNVCGVVLVAAKTVSTKEDLFLNREAPNDGDIWIIEVFLADLTITERGLAQNVDKIW